MPLLLIYIIYITLVSSLLALKSIKSLLDDLSDQSLLVGRNLRRALDLKVKKLRSLLTADEDITTELDKIVCRLMKLALRTSEDHQSPPPATWMQRKLLDLLALTEKAIQRRRKHFIENYPLKAIEYDHYDNLKNNLRKGLTLSTIQNDDTADKIVDKYLMLSSDPTSENFVVKSEVHYTEENLSITSNELDQFTTEPMPLYGEVRLESIKSESKEEIRLEIKQGWLDGDYEEEKPANDCIDKSNIESSDSNTSNDSQYRYKRNRKNGIGNHDEKLSSDMYVSSKNKMNKFSKTTNRGKQSKNKLIKKVSKKTSIPGQLAKSYSKKFEFVEYKSYTLSKPKRILKEHYNLQPTLSKPIPRSLIELCYQDLSREKSEKLIESSLRKDNIIDDVAATKESFFIDIVGENLEESFALRRSIATEADQKSDIIESEAILETVINVTKDDSFDAHRVVPFETVDSETIFLYDLNEPSTSKGIRHVSADAQCGTDRVCSISSAVNSLMNLSNPCETGIKISDSFTKLRFNKKSVDFGTVTDGINFYHDLYATNALKIKDSGLMLNKKVECSTMTHDYEFKLDKVITPILNVINTQETNSELRVCSSNLSKSGLRCLKNPSDSVMSQIISVTKYIRPKLSCCGIHVHSYRDRQVSEDVIFQGEWQKKGPTIVARKSPCALNIRKREYIITKKKVSSKEKLIRQRKQKDIMKVSDNVPIQKQNIKYTNPKREIVTKDHKKYVPNTKNHNVSKVASKIVTSVIKSRSGKNISAIKNRVGVKSNNINNYSQKSHLNNRDQFTNSNQKKSPTTLEKLNNSLDNSKSPNKIVLPVIRSKTKTKEFKENLIKFSNEKRKNITYLVFRNEIENTRNANTSLANSKSMMKIDVTKNNYSSTSQNSSPCSSPNSIATVRALSTKSKIYSNKRNSSSPENNNLENVSVENNEVSTNKRHVKSTKSTKTMNESSASYENKENLPHTSKKRDTFKDVDKSNKTMVSDRNKNVFMLQVRTESPSSVARKKSENSAKTYSHSSTKILKNKNVDNHKKVLSSYSFNRSLKDRCKSPDDTFRTNDKTCGVSEINNLTRSSTPILDKMEKFEGHECVDEQLKESKHIIKRSNSKINAAMKQLIEERLSFIKRIPQNDSDSETIILSRNDQDSSVNESLSPISYKTVVNENNCNISGRDIENALLNFSFESNLESLATLGSTQSRFHSIETDLVSFRSTESMTKCSESIIHQNELDKTLVPQQSSNTKSVRDLFERKDQPVVKNAGALAVQVFSGFSMDGEVVVGDQPEYTRLIDPETGNLEMARQANSEEIFVSGRSSDTYESCYVEDDAFLPNWLFRIISQQQSAEVPEDEQDQEQEQEPEPEPEDPLVDPEDDVNGNIDAGFGAGVGAGDGRGMHSDQSQDSSGRGTSISSSDVSSGPQSEAIIIDPSAFLGSAPRTGTAIGSTVVAVDSSDTSFRTIDNTENDNETQYTRDNAQRRMSRVAVASDADADVSSMGTDAADSDN